MTKDIKDYLHLYWGCEVSVTNLEGRYNTIIDQKFINTYVDEDDGEFYNDPKPILRQLSDMTEEERIYLSRITAFDLSRSADHFKVSSDNEWGHPQVECSAYYGRVVFHPSPFTICYYNKDNEPREYSTPEIFRWLLSKGFDLFNLIPEGLAIDKTTLKQEA